MALQMTFTSPRNGEAIIDGYIKVLFIRLNNNSKKAFYQVGYFLNKANADANKGVIKSGRFEFDILTIPTENGVAEAYSKLKTLPEFATAIDYVDPA